MPGYKTHIAGGLLTYLLMSYALANILKPYNQYWIIFALASAVGSIFPDIDIKSKMQQLFFIVATAVIIVALWQEQTALFLGLSGSIIIVTLLKHRTITHQAPFLIGMPLCISASIIYCYKTPSSLTFLIAFFFIAGSISHILLDYQITAIKRMLGK